VPTRSGWGLGFVGLAFIVAGRLFGAVEFLVVGTVAIAAVAIAALLRQLRPSQLAVARKLTPPRIPAGEAARVDLDIVNHAPRRSPLIRLHDAVSGTRGVHLSVASMAGDGGSVHGAYRLPTSRRGVLELGPIQIDDVDGLGLARRRQRVNTTTRLVVHPPIEDLPALRVPAGDDPLLGEELRQSLGLSDEEFDGLREYVPGDDLRKIHWASSARTDDLQVRQFRPPRHGRLAVVIDTRSPSQEMSALDVTTSVAASVAASVLKAGDATRVETTDGRTTPLMIGESQLDPLLEFLALLEGGAEQVHPTIPGGSGTVVAVTADPVVASDADIRRRFAIRLRAAVVITVDAIAWGQSQLGAASSGDWIHLTGPNQLAGLWRLGRSVPVATS